MTRKERILKILKRPSTKLTCQAICKKIIKAEKIDESSSIAFYLSGSISSILAKLVKTKVLRYSDIEGPRGGHIYEMNEGLPK
jgi:hypothetical protein